MRIAFVVVGNSSRSGIITGQNIRYNNSGCSGTESSVIYLAEYLVRQGHECTIALEFCPNPEISNGVHYTDLNFAGETNRKFNILMTALWFNDYDNLPIVVDRAVVYWYHLAWGYAVHELSQYANKHNLKVGLVSVSNWAKGFNDEFNQMFKNSVKGDIQEVVIPNSMDIDLIERVRQMNIPKQKHKVIFHAQWSRGGVVAEKALQELDWKDLNFKTFDYVQPETGVDKLTLLTELASSEYFIFPQLTHDKLVYKDTFSLSVAEAIAMGVTVVTYPLGALPEYFKDYCYFLDWPEGVDIEKLNTERLTEEPGLSATHTIVEGVEKLEADTDLKNALSEGGFEYIKDNFSIEVVGPMWVDFLSKLRRYDNPFSFFDKVFYINLDSRPDRRKLMEEQFERYSIKAERFPAVNLTKEDNDDLVERGCNFHDNDRPEYAPRIKSCTLSHLYIIFKAKMMGYKNILIFEDDGTIEEGTLEELAKCINELQDLDWDMFYLGCNPLKYFKATNNLGRVLSAVGAWGIALNAKFYDQILNDATFFKVYPCIDGYYGSLGTKSEVNSYMALKNLVYQRPNFSDIEGTEVDYRQLVDNHYIENIVERPGGY